MQRWLNTPRRQEPYVAGHSIAEKSVQLRAEMDQALRVLQNSPQDGKL
jgi:hypothetical protein